MASAPEKFRAVPADVVTDSGGGSPAITVAVVDEQAVSRVGLERVLSLRSGTRVVASVSVMSQLAPFAEKPDVVLAALAGTGDIARTLGEHPAAGAVLLILNGVGDLPPTLGEMLRRGVAGAITRKTQLDEVLLAVDAAARGAWYVSSELAVRLSSGRADEASARPALTLRETETANLLAQGLTHRQIARRMGLTEETINTYVKRMRAKFNVGNKAALTRTLIEYGYVTVKPASDH